MQVECRASRQSTAAEVRWDMHPEKSSNVLVFFRSNDMLLDFVDMYKRVTQLPVVEAAHMELAKPSIDDAFNACVQQGATQITGATCSETNMRTTRARVCSFCLLSVSPIYSRFRKAPRALSPIYSRFRKVPRALPFPQLHPISSFPASISVKTSPRSCRRPRKSTQGECYG